MPEFQLVIPCFNEEKNIPQLISNFICSAKNHGLSHEEVGLILVENGSHDGSRALLKNYQTSQYSPWFVVEYVTTNLGYGGGVWSGLSASHARFLAWAHADQQVDFEDVFRGYKILREHCEDDLILKGVRTGRSVSNWMVSRLMEMCIFMFFRKWIFEANAPPKIFRRETLKKIERPLENGILFDLSFLLQSLRRGVKIMNYPVRAHPRKFGESSWSKGFFQRWNTYINNLFGIYRLSRRAME